MPTVVQDDTKIWQRRDRNRQLAIWAGWFVATLIFVLCWQLISEKTIWLFVTDAHTQAADLGRRMVPPKLSYMEKLCETLRIVRELKCTSIFGIQ